MKTVLLFLALLFTALALAQTTTDPNAPKFKFDDKALDYGIIEFGSSGIRELPFTNIGKSPLILSNVQTSCGCMTTSWPKDPILPGKSNVIKVMYDTKRVGHFEKTFTITSNADQPSIVMKIKGFVKPTKRDEEIFFPNAGFAKCDTARIKSEKPMILLNEISLDMGAYSKGKITKALEFYNAGKQSLLITKINFTAKFLAVEFPTDSIPSGESGKLIFTLDPSLITNDRDVIEYIHISSNSNNYTGFYLLSGKPDKQARKN